MRARSLILAVAVLAAGCGGSGGGGGKTLIGAGSTLVAPLVGKWSGDYEQRAGVTDAFSDYLAKVSPLWKSTKGVSTTISFPTGVGGKGNDGVAAYLGRNEGSIGYLGISYVFGGHYNYALVQNAAGKFPVPGVPSIEAAAKSVTDVPADNAISITNPPASASGAYPISTFSYALVPKGSPKADALRAFLTYAVTT